MWTATLWALKPFFFKSQLGFVRHFSWHTFLSSSIWMISLSISTAFILLLFTLNLLCENLLGLPIHVLASMLYWLIWESVRLVKVSIAKAVWKHGLLYILGLKRLWEACAFDLSAWEQFVQNLQLLLIYTRITSHLAMAYMPGTISASNNAIAAMMYVQ